MSDATIKLSPAEEKCLALAISFIKETAPKFVNQNTLPPGGLGGGLSGTSVDARLMGNMLVSDIAHVKYNECVAKSK